MMGSRTNINIIGDETMSVTSVTCEFTGTVTYANGSYEHFGVILDPQGRIYLTDGGAGANAIAQVQDGQNWLQSMLDLLRVCVPVLSPEKINERNVTDMAAKISGRISRSDGTSEDFIALYDSKVGRFIPDYHSTDAWEEAINAQDIGLDVGGKDLLDDMFQLVTDRVGNTVFSNCSSSSSSI